jgi:hypothetical protein
MEDLGVSSRLTLSRRSLPSRGRGAMLLWAISNHAWPQTDFNTLAGALCARSGDLPHNLLRSYPVRGPKEHQRKVGHCRLQTR